MHLRKLTLAVGLFGTMFSTWAFGLGLGEITLRSTLNQPLDAEIKLLQVRNLNEDDILVELASSADFQRFGIDRLFFLQNLKFDVQLDHPEGPTVRVRSDEPIREPYLVFLLQAQSPSSGRLLREYTLLMDLPVYTAESPTPVQAPARRIESPASAEPAIRAPSRPASSSAPSLAQREGEPYRAPPAPGRSASANSTTTTTTPASFDGETYGPVQANDTLWEIASRVRPSGVSMQQSMLALQRANPDAFINGNINLLQRGRVLRVPDSSEWMSLDQQSAVREVASQNNQWNTGRYESGSGAELAASSSRPSRPRSDDAPRGQLTLSAPGVSDQVGESSGAGSAAERGEALQNELAIASEQLDATQRENQELNSRIVELEEQITTMERLLDVSSAELRALQLAAEQGQSAEPVQVQGGVTAQAEVLSTATEAEEAVVAPSSASEPSAAQEASAPPAVQPASNVVSRQAPQPSLVDKLMGQIWYLLAGALAIIAGIAYVLFRRRQQEDAWESFEDEDLFAMDSDLPGEADEFMEDGAALAGAGGFSSFDEESADSDFDTDQPVEAETGDVVAEADIYIAYGKLDQAEEMLRRALNDDPADADARLKLLEVFVEKNDVETFDDQYRVLLATGDAGIGARGAELRSGFADAPAFVAGLDSAQEVEETRADDSDLLELKADDELAEADFGDLDLSFDLDTGEDAGSKQEDAGQSAAALDFSLDLSDEFEQDDLISTPQAGEESAPGDLASASSNLDDSGFDFELDTAAEGGLSIKASDEMLDGLELSLDDDLLELGADLELATPEVSTADVAEDDFSFDLELDAAETTSFARDGLVLTDDLDLDIAVSDEDAENARADSLSFELDAEIDGFEPEQTRAPLAEFSLDDDALTGESLSLAEGSSNSAEGSLSSAEGSLSSAEGSLSSAEGSSNSAEGSSSSTEGALSRSEDVLAASDDDASLSLDALTLGQEMLGQETLDEDTVAAPRGASGSDDDFDIELGDLDLEALDQEMDALVGSFDDDDVGMAEPAALRTEAPPAKAEHAAALDLDLDLELEGVDAAVAELDERTSFGADQDFDHDDLEDEFDFLAESDEVATKLDLARAYIDMGDQDGARDILDEVNSEGNDEQKREAQTLLEKMV